MCATTLKFPEGFGKWTKTDALAQAPIERYTVFPPTQILLPCEFLITSQLHSKNGFCTGLLLTYRNSVVWIRIVPGLIGIWMFRDWKKLWLLIGTLVSELCFRKLFGNAEQTGSEILFKPSIFHQCCLCSGYNLLTGNTQYDKILCIYSCVLRMPPLL